MLCANPLVKADDGQIFPCGRCRACRVNYSRMWTGRILLEALCYPENAFVTLTYSPDHLPVTEDGHPTLSDIHWREFTNGIGYRYFGVGEYGDKFQRPHYHLALFDITRTEADELCRKRWKYGLTQSLRLDAGLASYIARYTAKKWLSKERLPSEQSSPEFQRMSRRPAIGSSALNNPDGLTAFLLTELGATTAEKDGIPASWTYSGKRYPLGWTLRSRLRDAAGMIGMEGQKQADYKDRLAVLLNEPDYVRSMSRRRETHSDFLLHRTSRGRGSL